MPEAQIGGGILHKDPALHVILHLVDMPAHHRERLRGHGQRQQIGEIGAVCQAPGDMLRHHGGLDPLRHALNAFEVRRVQSFGAAEREPDAVQRDRIVAANGIEIAQRRAAAHVVFGVDFHPRHVGTDVQHRLMVLEAQSYPGSRRNRAWRINGCGGHWPTLR